MAEYFTAVVGKLLSKSRTFFSQVKCCQMREVLLCFAVTKCYSGKNTRAQKWKKTLYIDDMQKGFVEQEKVTSMN